MYLYIIATIIILFSGIPDSAVAAEAGHEEKTSEPAPTPAPSSQAGVSDESPHPQEQAVPGDVLKQPGPTNAAQLSDLEKRLFVHTYGSDAEDQRLFRLEQFVFGKKLSGEFTNRVSRLRKALNMSEPGAVESKESKPPVAVPPHKEPSLIEVMNRGIDNYNAHRYHNAEDDFEECCAMAPGVARVFSYLAITKMQINQRQAAIDAFRSCYALDPFGTYGRYAKGCLLVLAGDEAIKKRSPVDSTNVLDSALDAINKDASKEVVRHGSEGETFIRTHASSKSYSENFIRNAQTRTDAAKRSTLAQESANNLKQLFATKRKPGDANLRAWGTNLTTRYYGDETYLMAPYYIPHERPQELRAQPKAMNSPTNVSHPHKKSHVKQRAKKP